MGNDERRRVLEQLLALDRPLDEIRAALAAFPWDSEEELVHVTPHQVASLLQRFLAGEVSRKEMEDWANLVEGRDDVGFPPGGETVLKEFIFDAANPELTAPLSRGAARAWMERLEMTRRRSRSVSRGTERRRGDRIP